MWGKPTTEQRQQDSGCNVGTTGLVEALVWRDTPVGVSVQGAAVIEAGVNPIQVTLSFTAP